jgi:hypothetical protein
MAAAMGLFRKYRAGQRWVTVQTHEHDTQTCRQFVLLVGAFFLLKVLIHLCTLHLGPYGYFRDEFYYLDCSANLDWGYVDQPPFAPFVLAVTRALFGTSLLAIRLPAILAGAGTVAMAGLLAREMGGGRFAQSLACLSVIAAPVFLTMGSFFSMNPFDYLFWAVAAYLLVRIIKTDNSRLWLWFGVTAGLGLENKMSMAFFGGMVAVAMIFTPQRKYYLDKNLWIGGAIALVIFLPNILWQVKNGWPSLEFMRDTSAYKNLPVTFPKFLLDQLIVMGPLTAPVWIAGLFYGLFSKKGRTFLVFSLVYLGLVTVFYFSNGKSYYLAPVYPALFALGAVFLEQATAKRRLVRDVLVSLIVLSSAVLSTQAMPLLPPETLISLQNAMSFKAPQQERAHAGVLPQHIGDRLGWEEMFAMIADAYQKLDPADRKQCRILVSNYAEAGCVNLWGPKLGMPRAISGYMNYYLWGPGDADGGVMLVYLDDPKLVNELFEQVTEVARFSHPYVMARQNDRPLFLCRKLKIPMKEAWPGLKRYY